MYLVFNSGNDRLRAQLPHKYAILRPRNAAGQQRVPDSQEGADRNAGRFCGPDRQ